MPPFVGTGVAQREQPSGSATDAVPGELIVRLEPSVTGRAAGRASLASLGAEPVRTLRLAGHELIRVPPGREEETIERLERAPGVVSSM